MFTHKFESARGL